jgi:ribosomal protein S27AE
MTGKRDCYRLFQEIVTARNGKCRRCGTTPISAHHIFHRNRMATAFLPENGIGLCAECHQWAHQKPALFRTWIMGSIGADRYEKLRRLSLETCRLRGGDFADIRDRLRVILDDLNTGKDLLITRIVEDEKWAVKRGKR